MLADATWRAISQAPPEDWAALAEEAEAQPWTAAQVTRALADGSWRRSHIERILAEVLDVITTTAWP